MADFATYFNDKLNEFFLTANGFDTISSVSAVNMEDFIYNYESNTVISGTDDSDNIYNGAAYVDGGSNVTIFGYGGNDYIQNGADYVTVDGGSGNNLVTGGGDHFYVSLGSGNDYIQSAYKASLNADGFIEQITPSEATLDAGDGNNIIANYFYKNASILSGSGDDIVYNAGSSLEGSGSNVTIKTGQGNDSIALSNLSENFIYNLGDGNDSIWGYTSTNNLNIIGASYSSATVDNNIVITVGEGTDSVGTITLIDAAGNSVNIAGDGGSNSGGTTDTTPGGGTTETTSGGYPAEISSNATDYVFIFDTSGSMDTYINRVKDIAANFTQQLKNKGVDYRLGIVEYEDVDSIATYDFTTDVDTFTNNVSAIAEKTSGGYEYGLTAIDTAIAMDYREGVGKKFILLTDEGYSENNYLSSTLDSTTVISNLNSNCVMLDVIGLPYSTAVEKYSYDPDRLSCQSEWEPLATVTGGAFYDINGDYNSIFTSISGGGTPQMHLSRWSYEYTFPESISDAPILTSST